MDIKELLAKANETSLSRALRQIETNQFDELDEFITDASTNSVPPNFNTGLSKDGNQLQVGDPVVGIHQGRRMSGQVIAIQNEIVTVEWRDRTTSNVKANQLELSNVDDDMELETMYIEAAPEPYMGFDKESFTEDTDLEALLKGDATGTYLKGTSCDL